MQASQTLGPKTAPFPGKTRRNRVNARKRTTGFEPATFGLGSRRFVALRRGMGGRCDLDATLTLASAGHSVDTGRAGQPGGKGRLGSRKREGQEVDPGRPPASSACRSRWRTRTSGETARCSGRASQHRHSRSPPLASETDRAALGAALSGPAKARSDRDRLPQEYGQASRPGRGRRRAGSERPLLASLVSDLPAQVARLGLDPEADGQASTSRPRSQDA
jgi:hypothetical protein